MLLSWKELALNCMKLVCGGKGDAFGEGGTNREKQHFFTSSSLDCCCLLQPEDRMKQTLLLNVP